MVRLHVLSSCVIPYDDEQPSHLKQIWYMVIVSIKALENFSSLATEPERL